MKILFGIQATGNGHISRCRMLAQSLHKYGAKVDYILSGRENNQFFDMELFGDFRSYKGMSFVSQHGKITLFNTLKNLNLRNFIKDINHIDLNKYDKIISDYEPITAWAAKKNKKQCIGISNQIASLDLKAKEYNALTRFVMKNYAPATTKIGLHLFHYGRPFLPPLIDVTKKTTQKNNKIIVYLPTENINDVISFLTPFKNKYQFECYHPTNNENKLINDITFKPLDKTSFTHSFNACDGVISNSGFGFISEAISLGKKLLTKPMQGQAEQNYNARCLKELKLGTVMKTLDQNLLACWLESENQEAIIYPDVASELAKWIINEHNEPLNELSARLWRSTVFPQQVAAQIYKLGYSLHL